MKPIIISKDYFVLRFDKEDDYPALLKQFLEEQKIDSAFFCGIGGFLEAEIAYYDLEKKKYISKIFPGPLEVASLTGNVALGEEGIIIHNHVVLGDKDFNSISGHLLNAKVAATLEIYLLQIDKKGLKRRSDYQTGLNLLDS